MLSRPSLLWCAVAALLLGCLALYGGPARADAPEFRFGLPTELTVAPEHHFVPLVERLVSSGFARERVLALFSRPEVYFDPNSMGRKMRVLYRTKYGIAQPPKPEPDPSVPREKIPLHAPHLTPEVVERLAVFRVEHAEALRAAQQRFEVPRELILAVLVVETKLGLFLGQGTALNSLAGMAAARGYEDLAPFVDEYGPDQEQKAWLLKRQAEKAEWAYGQLVALLRYAWGNGLDPAVLPGSLYGAIGMCQFMPDNIARLGVDGDGDGVVDVFNPPDAIHSVAKFLHRAGWKDKLSRKARINVIKRYNPDYFYAITVLAVAEKVRELGETASAP